METNLSWKIAEIFRQKQRSFGRDPRVGAWTPQTKQQTSMLTRLELQRSPVGLGDRWHGDRHFSARLSFMGFKLKVGLT